MASNCLSNSVCSKIFGPAMQNGERSSSDYTHFKSANTEYNYIIHEYIENNKTPSFASHKDYLKWKRMNTQLHSVIRVVSSVGFH